MPPNIGLALAVCYGVEIIKLEMQQLHTFIFHILWQTKPLLLYTPNGPRIVQLPFWNIIFAAQSNNKAIEPTTQMRILFDLCNFRANNVPFKHSTPSIYVKLSFKLIAQILRIIYYFVVNADFIEKTPFDITYKTNPRTLNSKVALCVVECNIFVGNDTTRSTFVSI